VSIAVPRAVASIRSRLILLVLAVWVPAAAGLALQARSTYLQQEKLARDNVLVGSVAPAALAHEGHSVTLCTSADEALVLLEDGASFDVLFTDIVMPGKLTGLELVEWARVNRPGMPALVATGYSTQLPQSRVRILRKPYSVEDLLRALHLAVGAHGTVAVSPVSRA
jgi:CheY-like chemotaxis protein